MPEKTPLHPRIFGKIERDGYSVENVYIEPLPGFYLAGNLEFLRADYESAVKGYDASLELIPGLPVDGGGDGIGRDAAYNRAIALARIQDKKKDAGPDASPDSGEPDGGNQDGGQKQPDGGQDKQDEPDAGNDAGSKDQPPPQTSQSQDERQLDQLERAPSVQQHDAKSRVHSTRPRAPSEDK